MNLGPTNDLRLAIIGAGPAGLSLAWYLRELGFRHVEILEATKVIGGQSITVDVGGVPCELGTCYMADGYVIAREIAQVTGTTVERMPPATFLDANGNPIKPPMPSLGSMARYVWKWLRWYFGGQLWKPRDPQYWQPFDAWLKANGLGELASSMVFADGCTAQLYGPINAITAHDGLSWVRPSLLFTGKYEQTARVPAGFQAMWQRLVMHLGYPVHTGQAVEEVRTVHDEGATKVEVMRGGVATRYDHVFIACPLDESRANHGSVLRHPLTEVLAKEFAPFVYSESYSAVWRASHWPLEAPSRCYAPACATGEPGRLLTIRRDGRVGDESVGQLCAYALENEVPKDYEKALLTNRARIVTDMQEIVGLRDIRIVEDRLWRYGIRFSGEQLKQGLPARIAAEQGRGNVWYSGGSLCHWDIDMIANMNQDLAWAFAKRAGLSFLDRLRIVRFRDIIKDI
jgi:hypothetical protein